MKEPNIYKYVSQEVRKYGFKKDYAGGISYYLDNRFELKVSRGRQVNNKIFEFEFSDMSKREPNYHWGGYISKMKLEESFDEKILYSTFDAWLKSIFESEELHPYMRSLKIKRIKKTAK